MWATLGKGAERCRNSLVQLQHPDCIGLKKSQGMRITESCRGLLPHTSQLRVSPVRSFDELEISLGSPQRPLPPWVAPGFNLLLIPA